MAKLHKRVLVLLVLLLPCSLVLAGGQGGSGGAGEVVTISMWKFGSPQHERAYILSKNKVFEEQNPGIKIEWSYQEYGAKREKVISGHTANQLPDIIALDGQSIPEFAEMGIILALD